MAAKKKPIEPTPPKKTNARQAQPIPRQAHKIVRKTSAADFRMKEEADKRTMARTDYSGATGFGHTTQSFSGPAGEYKSPSVKSAENYLRSKGVNPDRYTSNTGGNKNKSPKNDMSLSSSPSMSKPWSKAYWKDPKGGGATVNGVPRLFKSETNDAYKRVIAEIKLKEANARGMNSKGKIVSQSPNPTPPIHPLKGPIPDFSSLSSFKSPNPVPPSSENAPKKKKKK